MVTMATMCTNTNSQNQANKVVSNLLFTIVIYHIILSKTGMVMSDLDIMIRIIELFTHINN